MKKIIPVVILLLLLAGAAYAYTKKRPTSQAPVAPSTQTTGQTVSEAKQFADAIQSGRPTICTMSKGTDTMTYYVKGKMLKADIATAESKSHLINDTKYFYMWSDGQKQGTKMNLTLPSPSPYGSSAPVSNEPSTPKLENESDYDNLKNEGYTINCVAGNINDADFVPPSDVTFTDLSAMLKQAPGQSSAPQIDIEKLKQQYGVNQ